MESSKFLCAINGNLLESKSESKGVCFTKPNLVAYYEKNYDTLEPAKKILYFKKPKPETYPINLNDGYHRYIRWRSSLDSKTCLNSCLKYDTSSESKVSAENVDKIKIFTRRGTLVDLMEIYYQKKRSECKVRVTRYNGNLYMVREKDYGTNKLKPRDTHDGQFRKNVFTESFSCEPNINEPCDPNKGLIGVHQSSFGEFEIIYSGPIFGIEAENEFKDFDNLEALNTCRFVKVKQMWSRLEKHYIKYLHYWLAAYLANATDIYIAYKDFDGIVRKPIVHKHVSDLPKEFSRWKPSICTGFLYKFLHDVNKLMSNDNVNDLKTVYEFHIDLETRIITYKIFKDNPESFLVPPAYMEYCTEKD